MSADGPGGSRAGEPRAGELVAGEPVAGEPVAGAGEPRSDASGPPAAGVVHSPVDSAVDNREPAAGGGSAGAAAGPARSGATSATPAGRAYSRSALEAARLATRRSPGSGRRVAGRRAGGGSTARRGGYSGSGPDADRDPQPFGNLVRRLVADRGWEATTASASVLSRWDVLVGPEVAAKCAPVSLRDGELTLAAESTAWATQLRLLAPRLVARIRAELGAGVVTRVRVHGPTAPTWGAGRRRVAGGRGPGDTYG